GAGRWGRGGGRGRGAALGRGAGAPPGGRARFAGAWPGGQPGGSPRRQSGVSRNSRLERQGRGGLAPWTLARAAKIEEKWNSDERGDLHLGAGTPAECCRP